MTQESAHTPDTTRTNASTNVKDVSVTGGADKVDVQCLPCTDPIDNSHTDKPPVLAGGGATYSGSETDESTNGSDNIPLKVDIDGVGSAPEGSQTNMDGSDEISWWRVAPQYRQPPNGVLTYQLCRHYSGPQTCQYGEACSFAHGEKELAVWISLQAKNVDESYDNDDSVVVRNQRPGNYVLCKMFRCGGCDMGNECSFAHSVRELKAWNEAPDVDEVANRKTASAAQPGQALVIDANTPIRPPPKSVMCAFQLCKYLRSGVCPRGVDCPFAHGTTELRTWSKARRKQRQMAAKTIMNDLSAQSTEETEGDPSKSAPKKVRPPPVGLTMMPQLCSYFTESHCSKGYFCSFAHSVEELRAWEKARQSGHITRPYPRHVIGPMTLCKDGLDLCPLGSICPRAHSEAELESWHTQRDAEMAGAHLRHANSSRIRPRPLGFNSPFQLCMHYKAGRCTKPDCTFAHSETERAVWESARTAEKQQRAQQLSPQLSPQHGQYVSPSGAPAGSVVMVGDRYLGSADVGGYSYDLSPPGSPGPVYAPAPIPMSPHQQFAMMQQMQQQIQMMQMQQQPSGPVLSMVTPPASPVRHPQYVQGPSSPPAFELAGTMAAVGPAAMGQGVPQLPLTSDAKSIVGADTVAAGVPAQLAPSLINAEPSTQDSRPRVPADGHSPKTATGEAAAAAAMVAATATTGGPLQPKEVAT